MKLISALLLACVLGIAGCSKEEATYEVTCLTFFGPMQYELKGSEIGGLANSQATTYTLTLQNGYEVTLAKGACVVAKQPAEVEAQKAE